jgi:hypothetical protein
MMDGIPLDADARERRQQLERIAFGRPHSREGETAAFAARKELAEVARAARVAARELAASHALATEPPSIDGVSAGQPSSLKEADAWFETLPRASDALLDPDVARGLELDPATIRFVQSNAADLQVWIARKLDGDLCVVGSEAEGVSAFAGCNTREGFARSGVTVSHGGYLMIWNGSSVTVTMPRPVVTR